MHGYVTTESLILSTDRQYKAIPSVPNLSEAYIRLVQLEAAEFELVQKQLKATLGEEKLEGKLRIARDEEIAQWEHFPPRLGRVSLGLIEQGKTFDHQSEHNPLRQQLRLIRERNPGKTHFHFAIVNGFGGNLGDNLIGITAFREVAKVLAAELSHFSVDILYGWMTNPACRDLLAHEPYIRNVFFSGLSLAEFGQYEAHFDIAHLIMYPRYDSMPSVDWYLWWLGLEPQEIDPECKRNRLTFPYSAWQAVASLLRGVKDKRILLCHKASVPLRTLAVKQARHLVTELLRQDKDFTLILDKDLEMTHPRVLNLDGKIDSPDKLKALIAQVDGLISIDSFPPHVADATATPTVMLSIVLPPEYYPYYPHMQCLVAPKADELTAWKRVKTSEKEWQEMEPAYADCWKRIKASVVWDALKQKMEERTTRLASAPVQFNFAEAPPRSRFTRLHEGSEHRQTIDWLNDQPPPAWQKSRDSLLRIGQALLRPGCVVVHIAPGGDDTAVRLAEFVHPRGHYHLWEPRRLYAQTQAANFMLAGLDNLYLHAAIPAKHADSHIPLTEVDPYTETNSMQAGNAHTQGLVQVFPLDSVPLSMCRLLIVQPPMPYTDVIASGQLLLKEHNPFVILGPVPQEEAGPVCVPLRELGYVLWAESAGQNHRGAACLLIVAVPPDQNVTMQGFIKVEIN